MVRREDRMNQRNFVLALGALLFALCVPLQAQQPTQITRVGFLIVSSPTAIADRLEAFRQGLRDLVI